MHQYVYTISIFKNYLLKIILNNIRKFKMFIIQYFKDQLLCYHIISHNVSTAIILFLL